ncbi:MAG: DUF1801 domain-containing protein [Treponema sp.]|jgi:uncharacterized protein YdhG (YjbR/CyaY superfamily)|nr:DUF1801 domain-containing protein [Treponema sp.]
MKTIDEYIEAFEPEVQKTLREIRAFIKAEVPEAAEKISYGMPTFYLEGNLVHFAAFKDHYGFFPGPSGIDAFGKELAPYRTGKGTLRFPRGQPFPWELLAKVLRFRKEENTRKAETRGNHKGAGRV